MSLAGMDGMERVTSFTSITLTLEGTSTWLENYKFNATTKYLDHLVEILIEHVTF